MKLAIITGGSKGLGLSLIEEYCNKGFKVISIARNTPIFEHANFIDNIEFDLSQIDKFDLLEQQLFSTIDKLTLEKVLLINNAGRLGKISSIENCSNDDMSKTIQLNVTAPLLMSSMFLRKFANSNLKTEILMISSGAGLHPYAGWTSYCTSKAGIELMTKSIALEQVNNNNVRILSLNPGVMDTQMQVQIRNTKKADFDRVDRFLELKKENQLASTSNIAKKIVQISENDNYNSGETIVVQKV